jgi:hypothetical protein
MGQFTLKKPEDTPAFRMRPAFEGKRYYFTGSLSSGWKRLNSEATRCRNPVIIGYTPISIPSNQLFVEIM